MTAVPVPTSLPDLAPWTAALAAAPAFVAAGAAALVAVRRPCVARAWRLARVASLASAALAVAVAVARIAAGTGAGGGGLVRVDDVTVTVLALVALVGAVVVRYSATYLAGDARQHRYVARLLATLAAVSAVVVTNHLLVLVAAWAAASVALHGLLTHFGQRPVAVAVAHKKFLLARAADACMVGAAVAFAAAFDTLRIDGIVGRAVAAPALPGAAVAGIVLVACAAVLKCAQLPFHGWLIQVMEAPTPVSALLHAGVVNLGGVVLLRFAPVVDRAVAARTLLVLVGAATAVVAAVVMTTRVSVKVALAWSTCAQMGFMLVQCGLGAWEMALLHLLAHSVYKAHAFLGAGGTVRQAQRRQLAGPAPAPTARSLAAGAALAAAATVAVGMAWPLLPGASALRPTVWVLLAVVALAAVPLTLLPVAAGRPGSGREGAGARAVGRALALPAAYLALHEVVGRLVPHADGAPVALLAITGLAFAALFALQAACALAPRGVAARRIRPWVYAGLFLDEAFTGLAFRLSPPRPATPEDAPLLPAPAVELVLAPATGGRSRAFAGATAATRSTAAAGI